MGDSYMANLGKCIEPKVIEWWLLKTDEGGFFYTLSINPNYSFTLADNPKVLKFRTKEDAETIGKLVSTVSLIKVTPEAHKYTESGSYMGPSVLSLRKRLESVVQLLRNTGNKDHGNTVVEAILELQKAGKI